MRKLVVEAHLSESTTVEIRIGSKCEICMPISGREASGETAKAPRNPHDCPEAKNLVLTDKQLPQPRNSSVQPKFIPTPKEKTKASAKQITTTENVQVKQETIDNTSQYRIEDSGSGRDSLKRYSPYHFRLPIGQVSTKKDMEIKKEKVDNVTHCRIAGTDSGLDSFGRDLSYRILSQAEPLTQPPTVAKRAFPEPGYQMVKRKKQKTERRPIGANGGEGSIEEMERDLKNLKDHRSLIMKSFAELKSALHTSGIDKTK